MLWTSPASLLRQSRLRRTLLFALLLGCIALPARADLSAVEDAEGEPEAGGAGLERTTDPQSFAAARAGYRFITPVDVPAAAAPYTRLKSGVTGGVTAGTIAPDLKLDVEAAFLHEDDYHAELFLDYGGLYRLHLENVALWHNLLREPLTPGTLAPRELDAAAGHGIRSTITQVDGRIKLGNNPLHLHLAYWELGREGFRQLIFSDHAFDGTQPLDNSIISRSSRVDTVTREGSIGLDGHLGFLDLSYGFRIRDFSNQAPDNRDVFIGRAELLPGSQAHDLVPESRVISHSFKLFTDMSGGLVGSAAYVLTQRENGADRGDARPSSHPADTLHSVAGDLSYTPLRALSFALKYRRLEIDRDSPLTVFHPFSQVQANPSGVLPVRPSSDTVRDSATISATYRPSKKTYYRLEYQAQLESRTNLPDRLDLGNPAALRSDSRQTHSAKANLSWEPYKGMKLNATYSYDTCDNPAFPASFSDRHTGKLFLSYNRSGRWGATASYLVSRENGSIGAATVTSGVTQIVTPSGAAEFRLPRENRNNSVNTSVWFSPLERLTITASHSFLQSDIDQTILFTTQSPGSLAAGNYLATAHVYGIDAAYALSEQLDLSLAFQQVRSNSRFNVQPDSTYTVLDTSSGQLATFTTAGITGLTRLDTTETGIAARADWRVGKHVGCALDYSFRLFDSGNPLFDGAVHATSLALTARW
ncbi:MAG: MtrB/PioB family outer membrane beta-barrel protein [Deltaproteobacteria bacterium]|nr:MtrB/PioB family outer membrane beta-barrel protein [Deltaproteobacteria bacterium]